MRAHKLKTWPAPWRAIERGDKTCELRKADRDYQVGDYLMLLEYLPTDEKLTGNYVCRRITHIITSDNPARGLLDGFVILSLDDCGMLEKGALRGQSTSRTVEWLKPLDKVDG